MSTIAEARSLIESFIVDGPPNSITPSKLRQSLTTMLDALAVLNGPGFTFKWSTATTTTDPGEGYIKANNANPASATAFRISETSLEGGIAGYLTAAFTSTSASKGFILIFDASDRDNFIAAEVTSVTDEGAFRTLSATVSSVNGSLLNDTTVVISIAPRGNEGSGADTFAGRTITGTDGQITVTNGDGVSGNPTLALDSGVYLAGGTDVGLADGGTGASLADPNADRMMFWDDSANAVTWLAPAAGVSIDGTTLLGNKPPTLQVFTSSGTWNRPSGCRAIKVTVVGGGGGGGGTTGEASNYAIGGGGGSGGLAVKVIDVTSISSETVTIGAGGSGGTTSGSDGSSGGSSSFGAHCSATGGNGGLGQLAGTTQTSGGAPGQGGSASNGDLNFGGNSGFRGLRLSGTVGYPGGNGGPSAFGGMARQTLGQDGENGVLGSGGAGASSSSTARSGGAGGDGFVLVEEFY